MDRLWNPPQTIRGQMFFPDEIPTTKNISTNERQDQMPETDDIYETDDRGVVEIYDPGAYKARFPDAVITTCGSCDRSWDDSVVTSVTPAPSARCVFEYEHEDEGANDGIDGLEVVSYVSDIDGAIVVEISYAGHLRVVVGEGTVFDQDTEA